MTRDFSSGFNKADYTSKIKKWTSKFSFKFSRSGLIPRYLPNTFKIAKTEFARFQDRDNFSGLKFCFGLDNTTLNLFIYKAECDIDTHTIVLDLANVYITTHTIAITSLNLSTSAIRSQQNLNFENIILNSLTNPHRVLGYYIGIDALNLVLNTDRCTHVQISFGLWNATYVDPATGVASSKPTLFLIFYPLDSAGHRINSFGYCTRPIGGNDGTNIRPCPQYSPCQ